MCVYVCLGGVGCVCVGMCLGGVVCVCVGMCLAINNESPESIEVKSMRLLLQLLHTMLTLLTITIPVQ